MSEEVEVKQVHKIAKKIVSWKVIDPAQKAAQNEAEELAIKEIIKPTKLERGDVLHGSTYKVKQPQTADSYKHGFYITINNIPVDGKLVPYEILIDTKNSECWSMLSVLTLTLTTLFRHQLDISHLLEEYRTIQDSKKGYRGKKKDWQEKPVFYNSIVGEIADVIEHHLDNLKYINDLGYTIGIPERTGGNGFVLAQTQPDADVPHYPSDAIKSIGICPECHGDTLVLRDGCPTCTDCGYSKCG